MKVVIVGGVAGGASVATRLRRLDESAEIILLERGPYVSFANCGLPYYIGGVIPDRNRLLVQTPEGLRAIFNIEARVHHAVTAIDRQAKTITVHNLSTQTTYTETYDKLVLSPGAAPFVPPIPGRDLDGVFVLRTIPDVDKIKQFIDDQSPRRAVVIGGGFIGIELAENLRLRGLDVTIVEMMDQVLIFLDYEMATLVHQHLQAHSIQLALGDGLKTIEQGPPLQVVLQSDRRIEADMVVLAIGVRPENELAKQAGLDLGVRGTIVTNECLQTSDPDIYAIGDAAQIINLITGDPTNVALAGPASKQGRLVADHIAGRQARYKGAQGTAIVKVFDLTVASTGLGERQLEQKGLAFKSVTIHASSHAGYYPGATPMTLKLLFADDGGRVLGAQIVGQEGVDKRIDVLATAMHASMTVFDLEELELAYAPPYGSTRDPVNIAGLVASNILRGDSGMLYWDDVDHLDPDHDLILDVRYPEEVAAGAIEGAINIPLPELRGRLDEIPHDRRIVVYCQIGQRAYYAYRILAQYGFDVVNLSGGYQSYSSTKTRPFPGDETKEI